MRRLVISALLALGLVTVPLGIASTTALSATGVIAGSGTSYTLSITNTGDTAIKCFALYVAPGVTVTTFTAPAGWAGGSNAQGFGAQSAQGIPPGGTATFTFTTAGAYPVGAGGDLRISADCVTDIAVRATGPVVPVTPGPGSKPCKCQTIAVRLDGTLINKAPRIAPDDHDFGVGFMWNMKCTKGKGTCKGTIKFSPPEILAGSLPKPKQNLHLNLGKKVFICQANCGKNKAGRFEAKMGSRDQLKELFGRTMAYTIKTKCGATTKTIKVMVSVNQNGKLRPKKK